jgi:carbohydrate binding protein with CBM4/9 domain
VPPLGQNRVRSLATLTAFLAAIVLLGSSGGASFGATSSNYSTIIFSDGFESGSLSAWDGNSGNGTATVRRRAAHNGSYGLRLTNATGQVDVVGKTLNAPVVDSSVSFWVRVDSAGTNETIAEARDSTSTSPMWTLVYDSAAQAFWFYP